MTPEEYSYIVQMINENAYERHIFLGIRADLERLGFDIRQISYEHYLRLRKEISFRYLSSHFLFVACS